MSSISHANLHPPSPMLPSPKSTSKLDSYENTHHSHFPNIDEKTQSTTTSFYLSSSPHLTAMSDGGCRRRNTPYTAKLASDASRRAQSNSQFSLSTNEHRPSLVSPPMPLIDDNEEDITIQYAVNLVKHSRVYQPPSSSISRPTSARDKSLCTILQQGPYYQQAYNYTKPRPRGLIYHRTYQADPGTLNGNLSAPEASIRRSPKTPITQKKPDSRSKVKLTGVDQITCRPLSNRNVKSSAPLGPYHMVSIQSLPKDERTCGICYWDYGNDSTEGTHEMPMRLSGCRHVFGSRCMLRWFQRSNKCPYCRSKLVYVRRNKASKP